MRSYGGGRFEDNPNLAIDLYALCKQEGIMKEGQTWVFTTKGSVHVIKDDYVYVSNVPDLTGKAKELGGSDAGAGNNVTGAIAAAIVKNRAFNLEYLANLSATWGMMGAIGSGALGAAPRHYGSVQCVMQTRGSTQRLNYTPNPKNLELHLRP